MNSHLKRFLIYLMIFVLVVPYFASPKKTQAATTEQSGKYPPVSVDFNISDAGNGQPKMIVYWTANTDEVNVCAPEKLWWQIDVYETDSGYHTDGANHILSTYNSDYTNETKNVDGTGWGKYYKAIISSYCNSSKGDELLGRAANTIFLNQKDQIKPSDGTCTGDSGIASASATVENFDDGTHTVHLKWSFSTDTQFNSYKKTIIKRPDGTVLKANQVDQTTTDFGVTSYNDNYANGDKTAAGNYTITSASLAGDPGKGSCTVPVTFTAIDTGTSTGKTKDDGSDGLGGYTPDPAGGGDNCGCGKTKLSWLTNPLCMVMCTFIQALVSIMADSFQPWITEAVK